MSKDAYFLDVISGRRQGIAAAAIRGILACGEPIYAGAVAGRNGLFQRGWRQVSRVDAPVISVGNLTTGGTGKTPVVAAIVAGLRQRRLKPGIASRGYRPLDNLGNDEKLVLEIECPGVPHRQDRDRLTAARQLVAEDRCDVVVLDDGFQHRRVARNLDIVLIDATNPWGYGRLLPRGLLREPRSSLRRADLVMVTRANQVPPDELAPLQSEIRRWTTTAIIVSRFCPIHCLTSRGEVRAIEELRGKRVTAFCGIGNPEAFRETVKSLGADLASDGLIAFPDHFAYLSQDIELVVEAAQANRSDAILCTLKDLVKIDDPPQTSPPILAVDIGLEIIKGVGDWETRLDVIARSAIAMRAASEPVRPK
jgi:tetraacyldisaccharide 4'-kinase